MNQTPFAIVHDLHGEALCDEHQLAEFEGLGWQRKDKPVVKVEDEEKPAGKASKSKAKKDHDDNGIA
jgi:hypothetical protein